MASAVLLHGAQRVHQRIDAETNGVGKISVEYQEFQNALIREVCGIHLAVALKRGAGAQQPDPLQIIEGVVGLVRRLETVVVIDLEQPGGGRGTLDIAAYLDKLPSL